MVLFTSIGSGRGLPLVLALVMAAAAATAAPATPSHDGDKNATAAVPSGRQLDVSGVLQQIALASGARPSQPPPPPGPDGAVLDDLSDADIVPLVISALPTTSLSDRKFLERVVAAAVPDGFPKAGPLGVLPGLAHSDPTDKVIQVPIPVLVARRRPGGAPAISSAGVVNFVRQAADDGAESTDADGDGEEEEGQRQYGAPAPKPSSYAQQEAKKFPVPLPLPVPLPPVILPPAILVTRRPVVPVYGAAESAATYARPRPAATYAPPTSTYAPPITAAYAAPHAA